MRILSVLILFFCFNSYISAADLNWKLHPVFDEEVSHLVDTPEYVYFTSRQMAENDWNEVYMSLFRYDKKGEELVPLSKWNFLNGNNVRDLVYNPLRGYLAVLYEDNGIDFIYNDGKIVNLQDYSKWNGSYDKRVNSLTIDPLHERLYLSTNAGIVSINDRKHEIAESRLTGDPFFYFCRVGDRYFTLAEGEIRTAEAGEKLPAPKDFSPVKFPGEVVSLYPLSDKFLLVLSKSSEGRKVSLMANEDEGWQLTEILDGPVYSIDYNASGIAISNLKFLYQVSTGGEIKKMERPSGFANAAANSHDGREYWFGLKRRGLASAQGEGESRKVTRGWILPNSPATFASTSFLNHPDKGFLQLNYGFNQPTVGLNEGIPFELSAYKDGRWRNYGLTYTDPQRGRIMLITNGMAIDPDNKKFIYVTSVHNGIVRLNLDDPQDVLHLSRANDSDSDNPGFYTLLETPLLYPYFANFSAPVFDRHGNLWMNYADWDDSSASCINLYCWTAEDRKISFDKNNVSPPRLVKVEAKVPVSNTAFVIPLLKTGNGLLLHARSQYDEYITLIDTGSTPVDTSDDHVYEFPYFEDEEGNQIDVRNINYLWEDPFTGLVWICHLNGVCYFSPKDVINGNFTLKRVKVARNDGTGMADYLLEGVNVNGLAIDGEGRKWFATAGGGVVCTSSSGNEIISAFHTGNSLLPDDVVYGICFNSRDNSLMISTSKGYAEYSLPMSSAAKQTKEVKAYPNPVRPEFSGYLTITDIPQGSLVKITDIAGNLVKVLGRVNGFEILWDLTDTKMNRVKGGVYHILVSPGDDSSSYHSMGKVLVMT